MEKNNYIVAIDLGSSHVAVAVGSRTADGRISVEDVVVKESKGVSRGEVKNVELAAQSLKEAVTEIEERLGIGITEAVTGISGSHIKCAKHPYYVYVGGRDGEICEEDVVKLNESMRNVQAPDGYKLMHIVPQHYLVDNEEEVADPVGMFGKTLGSTFNLIIGDHTILSRLDKAFQKVNIRQEKLFINPLVAAEAVTFPDEKDLGVAVVDLGAGTTDLVIYQDGIMRYVGVIPIGAETINRDIRAYGIMDRHVEELKVKYGCAVPSLVDSEKLVKVPGRTPHDYKEISFQNLASIIEARLTDIADYVVEEIKVAGYEGKLSAGMILTGGCAQLKEIKTLFQERTGMEVRIAMPDVVVDDVSKEKVADPRMAAVVGLLYEGLKSGIETKTTIRVSNANKSRSENKGRAYMSAEEVREVFNPIQRTKTEPAEDVDPKTDPFADDNPEEVKQSGRKVRKSKKKGWLQNLIDKGKKTLEDTFDMGSDILDDDNKIV